MGSWSLYISKFLELYAADVGEHFRPPTVQETEDADGAAMQEVLSLCFSGSSLDDALSNIAVDRFSRHFPKQHRSPLLLDHQRKAALGGSR